MRDCTRVAQRLGVLPVPTLRGVVRRWGLTAREVEVLALLARASSIRQIGRRLDIHPIEPPTHPASWPGAAAAAAFWTTAALIGHGPGHVTDPCRTYPRPGQRCLAPNTCLVPTARANSARQR
jgi:hypothetical protein